MENEMEKLKVALDCAYNEFDNADSEEAIDSAIFLIKSIELKIDKKVKEARENGRMV